MNTILKSIGHCCSLAIKVSIWGILSFTSIWNLSSNITYYQQNLQMRAYIFINFWIVLLQGTECKICLYWSFRGFLRLKTLIHSFYRFSWIIVSKPVFLIIKSSLSRNNKYISNEPIKNSLRQELLVYIDFEHPKPEFLRRGDLLKSLNFFLFELPDFYSLTELAGIWYCDRK